MKKIAVIPARGGSKRIPRKNIKPFCGKPMLQWTIECALNSDLFERVIVSTEDEYIAEIAISAGAEVPFLRPAALADDLTATMPVVCHVIEALDLPDFAEVCCIYPTAVFTTAEILQQAFTLLNQSQADFVMPVTAFSCPIGRALKLDDKQRLTLLTPENENTRTQDCKTFYHDVGQFYLGRAASWLAPKSFYANDVKALIVPKYLAHDIDTPEDWYYAELVFRAVNDIINEL